MPMSIAAQPADQQPPFFLDPVTYEVMQDPVVCNDGRTYDRSTAAKLETSPYTRKPLHILVDNVDVRGAIFEAYPDRAAAYRKLHENRPVATVQPKAPLPSGVSIRRENANSFFTEIGDRTYRDKNGGIYVGDLQRDRPHGHGTYQYPSGRHYTGGYRAGAYDGHGRLTHANGIIYDGEFRNGSATGQATVTWPDGTQFVGACVRGVRQGHGVLTVPAIGGAREFRYEGPFANGEMHGWGIEYRGSERFKVLYQDGDVVAKTPD
jgi:hypothetical protein